MRCRRHSIHYGQIRATAKHKLLSRFQQAGTQTHLVFSQQIVRILIKILLLILYILQVLYDNKVLGKFCGHENSADGHHPGNQPIVSPGNRLTLIFQTDKTNPEHHQNVGFSAHYQAMGLHFCFLCQSFCRILLCTTQIYFTDESLFLITRHR